MKVACFGDVYSNPVARRIGTEYGERMAGKPGQPLSESEEPVEQVEMDVPEFPTDNWEYRHDWARGYLTSLKERGFTTIALSQLVGHIDMMTVLSLQAAKLGMGVIATVVTHEYDNPEGSRRQRTFWSRVI
jgi:hypothetical protein